MYLSIIIPAYNEEKRLQGTLKKVRDYLSAQNYEWEVLIVNDGSKDATGKIIDELVKKNKHIRVIRHKRNKGFTGAMKACLYSAKKHLIFLAPADGQFDFKELSKFIDAIRGYDVAVGYRVVNEENLIRKFNSLGFHFLVKILFGISLKEFSTVSLWRRRVVESIEIKSEDRSAMFLPELIYKAMKKNYKFVEVPIHWHLRRGGKAKGAGLKTIIKTFMGMLVLWSKVKFFHGKMIGKK